MEMITFGSIPPIATLLNLSQRVFSDLTIPLRLLLIYVTISSAECEICLYVNDFLE